MPFMLMGAGPYLEYLLYISHWNFVAFSIQKLWIFSMHFQVLYGFYYQWRVSYLVFPIKTDSVATVPLSQIILNCT